MRIIHGRSGAPSENRTGTTFTGEVWAEPVLPTTDRTTINTVTFVPGARTHWHSHEHGQVLQVVSGRGLVCADGDSPVELGAGDVVWAAPGERHWHGAAPESMLCHHAVSLGQTRWEGPVTDAEYAASPEPAAAPAPAEA